MFFLKIESAFGKEANFFVFLEKNKGEHLLFTVQTEEEPPPPPPPGETLFYPGTTHPLIRRKMEGLI